MPTRVLHAVNSLEPQAGSPAIALPGLCAALHSHGVDSEVVTSTGPAPKGFGTVVHTVESESLAGLIAGFDLVHVHGWSGDPATRAVASHARKIRKPYIISPTGSLMEDATRPPKLLDRFRRRFMDPKLLQGTAAIAALNEKEADGLRGAQQPARVVILASGLDFTAYESSDDDGLPSSPEADPVAEPESKSEGRCLLMLGPIDPVEGQVMLLKAFAELGRDTEGWHVVLAGEERQHWQKALEAAVRRKGAVDRVQFERADTVAAQRAWLARADLLVAPSLRVRPAVSVLQAIAAGVPVLATDLVAPPGLNDSLAVCEPTRVAVKTALGKMLRMSDDERGAQALRSHKDTVAVYDWSVLARRYADCYEECCSRSRRL